MPHFVALLLGTCILAASGCFGTAAVVPGSVVRLASGASCVVPIDDGDTRIRVTDASRLACVSVAQLIEPTAPTITDEALWAGPPSAHSFASEESVYCRLESRAKQGGSLKFRCMRTDSTNQLYDEDGDLIPEAKGWDDAGRLLDAAGKKIRKPNEKARQVDELRVKYFLGSEPAPRYREMFTETAVSHIFWVLGIPVDRVYMPKSVRCFGCSANPFGQIQPTTLPTPTEFVLASIKRPYEGKKISITRKRGLFGLGGRYDHGFGFGEIAAFLPTWPTDRRVEAEVMATALNLVQYHRLSSYQNEMVCRRGMWDDKTGVCSEPVAYVSDVGGTLGGERAYMVQGEEHRGMKLHPRGDFLTFGQSSIFSDHSSCTLYVPIGGVRQVSEGARALLDARIRGKLGRNQMQIIFEKANIQRMEARVNDLVAAQSTLEPGVPLDRAVQLLWVDEMAKRLDEILTARCPPLVRSGALAMPSPGPSTER